MTKKTKNQEINNQPENLPIEEIVINLGFWITMAVNASQRLVKERMGANGVSEPEPDKK